MKDIIHPRNSLRKKHRLSARSDEIKIDESVESDNEDVFEDTRQTKIHFADEKSQNDYEVPTCIVERYQLLSKEENKVSIIGIFCLANNQLML